jgi:hypothetical protein
LLCELQEYLPVKPSSYGSPNSTASRCTADAAAAAAAAQQQQQQRSSSTVPAHGRPPVLAQVLRRQQPLSMMAVSQQPSICSTLTTTATARGKHF